MFDKDEEVADPNYNPEEEVAEGNWKIVDLPQVTIESGEKDEEEVFKARAKLYRWKDDQWKERGIGDIRILRNKVSGKQRAVLRQDQTLKIRCHFFIHGHNLCVLQKLKTAEKSLYWTCADFSEEKLALERFCIRLKTDEDIEAFTRAFNTALEENNKLSWTIASKTSEEKKDAPAEEKKDTPAEEKKEEETDKKKEEKTE